MSIEIGDRVFVIDENLDGEVISMSNGKIIIACNDGFEYEYLENQLYKINEDDSIEHISKDFHIAPNKDKSDIQIKKRIVFKGDKPVFDLHIEELTSLDDFSNAHEKLIFQLSYVKDVLQEANKKRVRRMVFVHGVGKGRLREELRKMLKESYPQIEFFDGDYRSFGRGATEIIIRQFNF